MLNQKLTGQQAADKTYIEDVFSTYLYTGNGSTQTINNGIDLASKGGMVWIKARNYDSGLSAVLDTARGATKRLSTNLTDAEYTNSAGVGVTSFNSNGFSLGTGSAYNSAYNYASWTFRKAPKFFDVVTYTGDGVNGRTISHSLGSVPGMIIIKCTNNLNDWIVYHRSGPNNLFLNNTNAAEPAFWITGADASTFTVNAGGSFRVNTSGATYVAYLFAHDTDTDGLIQCGSFTTDGSGNATVNLGWEPQYVLIKSSAVTGSWFSIDTMRGFSQTVTNYLAPNLSDAEAQFSNATNQFIPTATGFQSIAGLPANRAYIYMAIRRGPMKTPTDGTKVFTPSVYAGSSSPTGTFISSGFPVDLYINKLKSGDQRTCWVDRVRGDDPALFSQLTQAEESYTSLWPYLDEQLGIRLASGQHDAGQTFSNLSFQRAPGFFDVVCYTGTGVARTVNHNLGVAPELVITKVRSTNLSGWQVGTQFTDSSYVFSYLNQTNAGTQFNYNLWFTGKPSATSLSIDGTTGANSSGATYVAYLFASCPGVSKVGSYTGNGSSQTINCGFSAGARFVLIKRTDSTGDWYVWDTARGIVAATDPHLSLNTTSAEVTTDDTIDPDSTGFVVNQVAATNVNVSGGSYIYLAIA